MKTTRNGVREIASAAKVSIGTVSNVLNRPEIVSPETVERVHQAMTDLGYKPTDRNKGRRVLAFSETVHGKALIEKVAQSGVEVAELDLSDESKRERLIRYLLNNKSAAAAILVVTQAGQVASELSDLLNQGGNIF
jgi:LacI family transcriptional regulator